MSCAVRCYAAMMLGLLAALAGCTSDPIESHKTRVDLYLQTFLIEQDWSRWQDYFSPSASMNGSTFALQIMRGTAEGLDYSLGDMSLEIVEQVEEGDRVATAFLIRAIHERPFDGQPATHRSVALQGFVIDRFEQGKIIESRMLLDLIGLSRQVAAFGSTTAPPQ